MKTKAEVREHVVNALMNRAIISVVVKPGIENDSLANVAVETTTGWVNLPAQDMVDARNIATVAREIMEGKINNAK